MTSYRLFLLVAAALPAALAAQDAGPAGPASPNPPVPPVTYRSALTDYQPSRDTPVAPWHETNDTVGRLGGHMGHVRDAGRSASAPEPDAQKPPAAGSHDAHH